MLALTVVGIIVFLLNIPFGYWRDSVPRLSLAWVLSIHLPVPLVILFRMLAGIDWTLQTYPLLIAAFFLGQYIGVRLHQRMARRLGEPLSSCLVMDVWRRSTLKQSS